MGFEVFRSAGAPYKRPESHLDVLVPYPDSRLAYPGQMGIDWTPAARELGLAVRKRESKAQRILDLFREKGALTTWDLQRVTGRFSARLGDLKKRGFRYDREDFKSAGNEHSVYTMTHDVEGE
jgi:hypothetical protein